MIRKTLLAFTILFMLLQTTAGGINAKEQCDPANPVCTDPSYSCQQEKTPPSDRWICQPDPFKTTFGKIQPPPALFPFLKKAPTGAGGISLFLTNLVALIYSLAAIVLVFMILWGAFEWLISEGDKEKLAAAQRKIINALIGILLFAVAFAVIKVLGQFTGFTFFAGQ